MEFWNGMNIKKFIFNNSFWQMPWKFLDILSSVLLFIFFAWFTAEYSNLLKNLKEKLQKNEKIIYKKKNSKRHFWKLFFYFVKAQGYPWGIQPEKIRNSSVIENRWSRRACKIISTRISIKKCYVLIKGRIMSK